MKLENLTISSPERFALGGALLAEGCHQIINSFFKEQAIDWIIMGTLASFSGAVVMISSITKLPHSTGE